MIFDLRLGGGLSPLPYHSRGPSFVFVLHVIRSKIMSLLCKDRQKRNLPSSGRIVESICDQQGGRGCWRGLMPDAGGGAICLLLLGECSSLEKRGAASVC